MVLQERSSIHFSKCHYLQELGALQNPIAIFSETPLHEAAMLGDEECLQLLLDYGADTTLCKVDLPKHIFLRVSVVFFLRKFYK